MLKGSCCCGAIQFELSEQPMMLASCHCSRCRKVGASQIAFVTSNSFKLLSGKEHIAVFKATPPYQYNRCFCSTCGSALGEILSQDDTFPIAAHCIDSELTITNAFHEFVSEKPSWLEIGDSARQFEGHPE